MLFIRSLCIFLAFSLCAGAGASEMVIVEDFEGKTKTGYLQGAFTLEDDPIWTVDVANGLAVLTNISDDSALRFYDLPAVQDATGRRPTDGASIQAEVRALNAPNGGAGVLVGHPHDGDYLAFMIGSDQNYAVLLKQQGQLRPSISGTSDAVAEGFNTLLVEPGADGLAFTINGQTVATIGMSNPDLNEAPVGIAVFGQGEFAFDTISLAWPATPQP